MVRYLLEKEEARPVSETHLYNKIFSILNPLGANLSDLRYMVYNFVDPDVGLVGLPDTSDAELMTDSEIFDHFLNVASPDEIGIYLQTVNLDSDLDFGLGMPRTVRSTIMDHFQNLLLNYSRKEEVLDLYLILKDKLDMDSIKSRLALAWFIKFLIN